MRRVLALALLLLLPTTLRGDSSHISPGVFVDPVTNTIACDTGPLSAPEGFPNSISLRIMVLVVAAQTVDTFFVVEHRNAANDANVTTSTAPNGEIFGLVVHGTGSGELRDYNVVFNDQERVRLRLFAGITGRVLCRMSY